KRQRRPLSLRRVRLPGHPDSALTALWPRSRQHPRAVRPKRPAVRPRWRDSSPPLKAAPRPPESRTFLPRTRVTPADFLALARRSWLSEPRSFFAYRPSHGSSKSTTTAGGLPHREPSFRVRGTPRASVARPESDRVAQA